MPTYEYKCLACEHQFEQFQSITAAPLKKCPACGKPKLRRLIGVGAGVIFRGSGFYETDYRSESYKKAAKAESEAAGKTSGTDRSAGSTASPASSPASSAAPAAPADAAKSTPAPAAAKPAKAAAK